MKRDEVLPNNPVLKKCALLLAVTFSLGYAWLGSRLGEPSDRVPHSYVGDVLVLDRSQAYTLNQLRGIFFHETHRAVGELAAAEPLINALGGLKEKLTIVVDMDHPLRLITLSDRIVIGSGVVRAEGQLEKAVLKSWLLQNARSEIASSHLRLEVASDLLLAFAEGDLKLSSPFGAELGYGGARSWIHYASTYGEFCSSPWLAVELLPLCQAPGATKSETAPTLLSFRPLIGEMIWSSFQSLPLTSRLRTAKAWMKSLRDGEIEREAYGQSENGPVNERIAAEIKTLLPSELGMDVDMSPLSREMKVNILVDVDKDSGVRSAEVLDSLAETQSMVMQDGAYLTPSSRAPIANDAIQVSAKSLARIGCAAPTVREVVSKMSSFRRVIFIRSCAAEKNPRLHLASLARAGVFGFAGMNPDVEFIQFRPQSVALALKDGQVRAEQRIDRLLQLQSSNSLLGLDRSTWMENLHAFKVTGAIEAIEWFRMNPKGSVSSSI